MLITIVNEIYDFDYNNNNTIFTTLGYPSYVIILYAALHVV